MNIEEIKNKWDDPLSFGLGVDEVSWLIAEVERLEDMVAGLTAAVDSLGQSVYDLIDQQE